MGYEIYYDRRFLKIGDKICPIVQSGASNCTQYNWQGKEVAEKNWSVINYPKSEQLLFTPEELEDLYNNSGFYDDEPYGFHKSRESYHKDFKKWLLAGIKTAMTIEEHLEIGNSIVIEGSVYTQAEDGHKTRKDFGEYIKSDKEFFIAHEMFRLKGMEHISIGFTSRNINTKKRSRKRKTTDWNELDHYYVIQTDGSYPRYFVRLLKSGYKYTTHYRSSSIRKFKKQADAQKYLEEHWHRLPDFHVEKIVNKEKAEDKKNEKEDEVA